MNFRKQKAHTDLNKYIELARRSKDDEMEQDLLDLRKYLNRIEAQNLGLRKSRENLMERIEKNIYKY